MIPPDAFYNTQGSRGEFLLAQNCAVAVAGVDQIQRLEKCWRQLVAPQAYAQLSESAETAERKVWIWRAHKIMEDRPCSQSCRPGP